MLGSQNLIKQYDQKQIQAVKEDIIKHLSPILEKANQISASLNSNEDYLRNSEFTCQNLIVNCLYILDSKLHSKYRTLPSVAGVP